MKTRVLIIEPSEVIVEGLTSLLSAQTRFKVLPPLSSLDGLPERLVTGKPDVIVLNPPLASQPAQLLGEEAIPVVALVYQYVECSLLECFSHIIDVRASRSSLISRPLHSAEEIYACLLESHLRSFPDTSADQDIDICRLQESRKRTVPVSV